MKRSLIVLTYDEIDGVQIVLPTVPKDVVDEILIVDGGSKDGTIEFLRQNNYRVVVQTPDRKGRGAAFGVGMENTSGEHVVFFSPDGNEDPADIVRLFEQLEAGADIAIASRFLPTSVNEEDDCLLPSRKWVNQMFTACANTLWNTRPYITDTINGFRGIRRNIFQQLSPQSDGYTIEYEMTIKAFKAGLKITEIPTIEGQRVGGESYAKSLPTGLRFLKLLAKELMGK